MLTLLFSRDSLRVWTNYFTPSLSNVLMNSALSNVLMNSAVVFGKRPSNVPTKASFV
jgi:hypothetical protein